MALNSVFSRGLSAVGAGQCMVQRRLPVHGVRLLAIATGGVSGVVQYEQVVSSVGWRC